MYSSVCRRLLTPVKFGRVCSLVVMSSALRHLWKKNVRRPPWSLVDLEPRVLGHLKNRIFRHSKCRRVTQRNQDTLDPTISWPLKNKIFRWSKCLRGWHEASNTVVEDFRHGFSTNIYWGSMPQNITFSKFWNLKMLKIKKIWAPIFGLHFSAPGLFLKLIFCSIPTFRLPFLLPS